jgi:hypothetical protein
MEILNGIAFNPQPTARKSLFCTHVVLGNATIHTCLDLSSINAESITAENGSRRGRLDSITSTSTVSLSTIDQAFLFSPEERPGSASPSK